MRYLIEWKFEGKTYIEAADVAAAQENFLFKYDNLDGYPHRYQHPPGMSLIVKEYEDEPVDID
tara:strand:- start:1057 stop:1245 length:189 start_codon:yes stop_codon:yes gene_type:complete